MLKENMNDIKTILEKSRLLGWVLEPEAKELMKLCGLDVPKSVVTNSFETAEKFLSQSGASLVAKAVSEKILHKTEYQAVSLHINNRDHLKNEMERLKKLDGCETILIEEMVSGIEVIIGAKNDFQFGPVVVFGIGGTSVEIYNDTAIRMAPVKPDDVVSMVESLRAKELILGYRGRAGVNMEVLTDLIINFSELIMEFEKDIESIDLNPVICTEKRCVVADARIIIQNTV